MEINVKMFTEKAYATLQKNYKDVYKEIVNHPTDSSWLKDFIGEEPYETKKYLIEDFTLKFSTNNEDVAVDNAIVMYEALKDLPRYILCNNRFWGWILFEKFYRQAQKAIPLTENIIQTRWLIKTSRRELMLGVVSRQYYKVEVSIDETREDKYELSKFIIENHNPYKNITMRNIGMLKNVVVPYLEICKDMQAKGTTLNDDFCSSLMKEASRMGSVMLIDLVSKEDVYNNLVKKLDKIKKEIEDKTLGE